jgi:hypothetical protein
MRARRDAIRPAAESDTTVLVGPSGVCAYDVFGSTVIGGEGVRSAILALERVLGVSFETRNSSFANGRYLLSRGSTHGEIRFLNNVADDPEEIPYLEYRQYRIIVSVDYAVDAHATAALIVAEGFVHLRRRKRDTASPSGVNGNAVSSENVPLPI